MLVCFPAFECKSDFKLHFREKREVGMKMREIFTLYNRVLITKWILLI